MYPDFLKAAEAEKNQAAIVSFKHALAVEATHRNLYSKALETLKAGKDLPAASIYVCPICGHTEIGGAPDKCPVCSAPKNKFFEVK
jgi:rubrerythrin